MYQQKNHIRFMMTALLLCLTLLWTPQSVSAAEENTLTICYDLNGTTFSLYRVGEYTTAYTLTGDFADYAVELPGDGWREAAATLAAYALRDGLESDACGQTSKGKLTVSGLEEGLYLIIGESGSDGDYTYSPVPELVLLQDDLSIDVKYDRTEITEETVSYTVIKVWANDSGSVRPDTVTVQLLEEDGTVYDTVVLSSRNSWTYTWSDLSANIMWKVAEVDIPDGYTVSVSQENTVFTLTNTYQETEESTPSESEPETTPSTEPETTPSTEPEESSSTDSKTETSTETSTEPSEGSGAQTGDTSCVIAMIALAFTASLMLFLLLQLERKCLYRQKRN